MTHNACLPPKALESLLTALSMVFGSTLPPLCKAQEEKPARDLACSLAEHLFTDHVAVIGHLLAPLVETSTVSETPLYGTASRGNLHTSWFLESKQAFVLWQVVHSSSARIVGGRLQHTS